MTRTTPLAWTAPLAALALVLAGCQTGAAAEDQESTRTVDSALGEVEVPADPQRIVVLEPVLLDTAVALGVNPVGAAEVAAGAGFPAYLGDATADTQAVGTVQEPDAEAIAALGPDLILGTESRHADLHDQLAGIAPTVFMATQVDPWKDNARVGAAALGQEEELETALTAFDDRCQSLADEFDTEGTTAQLIRPRDGILSLYGPTSFAGSALECVGLTIPERDWEESISVDVSPELAADAAADIVLVSSPDPEVDDAAPEVVAAGTALDDAHVVAQEVWIAGVGPQGGQALLDDLEKILAER